MSPIKKIMYQACIELHDTCPETIEDEACEQWIHSFETFMMFANQLEVNQGFMMKCMIALIKGKKE